MAKKVNKKATNVTPMASIGQLVEQPVQPVQPKPRKSQGRRITPKRRALGR